MHGHSGYSPSRPTFCLLTFGCQMNVHDSEMISETLRRAGYREVLEAREAGIILLNTCSVRGHAEERVWGRLGDFRSWKRRRPGLIIGVIGCMAQVWGRRLWDRFPEIDLLAGPGNLESLRFALDGLASRRSRIALLGPISENPFGEGCLPFPGRVPFPGPVPGKGRGSVQALVTVMQGCDNFCSYCVVPYSRGKELSREPRLILAEIADVVSRGCREVTLLGQNVNAYRGRDVSGAVVDFLELLRRVDAVAGVERIRFATSHPRDISDRLAAALRDLERVCEQLHFPAQSGSDAVLARMNRGYTRQDYLARVAGLRQAVPGIALFSDLIVGFPGETGEDFAATIALLEEARFDRVYAFAYSSRPSTAAASLPDDVPAEVKAARLQEVLRRQREISREINRSFLGETVEVLVEERNLRFGDRGGGKTRGGTPVFFPWEEGSLGRRILVAVEEATPAGLYGKRIR